MKEIMDAISPETLKTQYLTPDNCKFYKSETGFTGAEINGEKHNRVILKRALPYASPSDYICITDAEKNELGIIERISDFGEKQRELINSELELRYFCPVITGINSIKEKMGHFYFDVSVNGTKKSFTVKDISKNIRMHNENIDITDVDGNRYRIKDISSISPKSRRKLEPYIY